MLALQNVSVLLDGSPVLSDINLRIEPGEFVFIVGAGGSGKSTLLRLFYLDLSPTKGSLIVENYNTASMKRGEVSALRRGIGVLLEEPHLLRDRNVFENVALPLLLTHTKKREIRDRVFHVLDLVGLSPKSTEMPHRLTSGESQRAALARALVNSPHTLLADEPTGNLDPPTAIEFLETLRKVQTLGTTILVATHNYDLVRRFPARIVQLRQGRLVEVELRR
jgi:cell division transport system ATP-binding protein